MENQEQELFRQRLAFLEETVALCQERIAALESRVAILEGRPVAVPVTDDLVKAVVQQIGGTNERLLPE
jgi:hypothetical protein